MIDFLLVLFNLFCTLQGFAFLVYLIVCSIWIKPMFLRIKMTEGEIVYNDERGDMGGKASFMGPLALLCLVFFYRPIFYHKTARKIKNLYGTGKLWLTDLFGIWLPIALFLASVLLAYFLNIEEYLSLAKSIPLLLPVMISETVCTLLLVRYSKQKFYVPDLRLND
ncbi:MAG: hypothetical protein J5993_00955 [Clostridia bacterium]|nr:hypothetical protein [Clostridia bacterium]